MMLLLSAKDLTKTIRRPYAGRLKAAKALGALKKGGGQGRPRRSEQKASL